MSEKAAVNEATGTIKNVHSCGNCRYVVALAHFYPGDQQEDWECQGNLTGSMRQLLDHWQVDDLAELKGKECRMEQDSLGYWRPVGLRRCAVKP